MTCPLCLLRRVSSETEEFLVMQFCWEPLLCPPPAPLPSSSPPNSSLIVVVVVVAQPSLFCLLKFVEEEVEVRDVGWTQEPTVITGSSQPKSSSPAHSFQVWSLNQFYSVEFSQSRISVKKVRFQQAHNQGLRQLSARCPGTCVLKRDNLKVSLFPYTSKSNA